MTTRQEAIAEAGAKLAAIITDPEACAAIRRRRAERLAREAAAKEGAAIEAID